MEKQRANSQGKNNMKRTQKGREMIGKRKADKNLGFPCLYLL